MTQSFNSRDPQPKLPATDANASLDSEKLVYLADPETQEEYRKAFLDQLRLRICPGCGDDGTIPG
jgi:hypothetical protein